jgi:hypothetical protein
MALKGSSTARHLDRQPPRLNEEHCAALVSMVENGPIPAVHEVVRWRIIDLCQWLWEEYEADAEPRAAGDGLPQAVGTPTSSRSGGGRGRGFQTNWPPTVAAIAQRRGIDPDDIEIWFGDEARIGQRNKITRRWARRGSPSAPSDQRTASTYIFGAICPKEGKAVGLILPWCNTAMMNLHLAAISADVAPGRHAVLLLDQAGWHLSYKLAVPHNITIVPLPPKCPELNPQENIWQFMRDNWSSNRVFEDAMH